jgi:hypothetical protein
VRRRGDDGSVVDTSSGRVPAPLCSRRSGLSHKLQVVRADFLDVPLPQFDALVANIPYQVGESIGRGAAAADQQQQQVWWGPECILVHAASIDRPTLVMPDTAALRRGSTSCVTCRATERQYLLCDLPTEEFSPASHPSPPFFTRQISSPVLSRLFAHRPLPSRAVIMFQLEFAERIVAPPGESVDPTHPGAFISKRGHAEQM